MSTISQTGHKLYRDEYGAIYETIWETVDINGHPIIDITTITREPRVWGKQDSGYVDNFTVFRYGICTTTRQMLQLTDDGYIVLAEGSNQEECVFQSSFKDKRIFSTFDHYLDSAISADVSCIVTCGSRWADPDVADDSVVQWETETTDGDTTNLDGTARQSFYFVDVWRSGNEELNPTAC